MPPDHLTFERCNSLLFQRIWLEMAAEIASIITSTIQAVMMKKSQRANLDVMTIRNICTFGYDMQGIYTFGPPSNERRRKTLEKELVTED